MKKRGLFSRIAALSMAAILAAAPVSTVFADQTTTPAITSVDFKKTVTADSKSYQPNATFTFTIVPGTSDTFEKVTTEAGVDKGVTSSEVKTDTTLMGTQTYKGTLTFNASVFTKPGVYHYQMTEVGDKNAPNITNDTTVRDLYVYVRNSSSGKFEVYASALVKGTEKTDTFTNDFTKNPGTNPTPFQDVTLQKSVTGDQGDLNKEFTFTVKIPSSADGRTTYVVERPTTGDPTTLTVGTPATFHLKSGETLTVKNLAKGDQYTIDETLDNNYKTSATLNGSAYTLKATTTMTTEANKVIVTNNRDAATPTGIIMNVAPYVIMILIAAAAAVLFFRKRRSAE